MKKTIKIINSDKPPSPIKYCKYCSTELPPHFQRNECNKCRSVKSYSIKKLSILKEKYDSTVIEKMINKRLYENDEITGNAINIRNDSLVKIKRLEEIVNHLLAENKRLSSNMDSLCAVVTGGEEVLADEYFIKSPSRLTAKSFMPPTPTPTRQRSGTVDDDDEAEYSKSILGILRG